MNKQLATFYLVRHGQTDWNKEKIVQGQLDIPLNAVGEQQAKDLAKKFKSIKFDFAFSSDLLRAKRTTEIMTLEHKLAVQTTALLRERFFGKLEGEVGPQVWEIYEKLVGKLSHEERLHTRIAEEAENDNELIARVITFLRETAIIYPGKTILVGTHSGILRALLLHLGKFTYATWRSFHIANTAYVKLETDGVDFFVKEINGVEKKEK